jgi:hypothetical protein
LKKIQKFKEKINLLTTKYISKKHLFIILFIINLILIIQYFKKDIPLVSLKMSIEGFNKEKLNKEEITYDDIKYDYDKKEFTFINPKYTNNDLNLKINADKFIMEFNENIQEIKGNINNIKFNKDFLYTSINKLEKSSNIISYKQIDLLINKLGSINLNLYSKVNGNSNFKIETNVIDIEILNNFKYTKNNLFDINSSIQLKTLKKLNKLQLLTKELTNHNLDLIKKQIIAINNKDKVFNKDLIIQFFNESNDNLNLTIKNKEIIGLNDFLTYITTYDYNNSKITLIGNNKNE